MGLRMSWKQVGSPPPQPPANGGNPRSGDARLSRRRFIAAVGLTAGAAAWLAACGGKKAAPGSTATPPPRAAPSAPTTARPSPTPRASAGDQHGEILRYTGFVQGDASFDPHKTQAGPFYGQEALVFSRLLAYADQAQGTILPDLATNFEQPDANTFVFTLNPAAKWQNRSPLNGRAVTAEDVKYSIERQMNGDASFVRKARWVSIDKIDIPEPGRIRFQLKSPLATMLHAFADVNAFIVAPELSVNGKDIDLGTHVGSGPFRWAEWSEGKVASVSRNQNWFGGNNRPFLDGITLGQPKAAQDIERQLRVKNLDAAFVSRALAESLKESIPALDQQAVGHSLYYGMRFFGRQQYFDDPRFRGALTYAVDRRAMIQQFFGGSGEVNPWVSWPVKKWTLPQSELTGLPGYRPGQAGRDADIKEARALLSAHGAEKGTPTELPLFVVDDAQNVLGMGSFIRDQIEQNLGLKVNVFPLPIAQLVGKLLRNDAPWVAVPDTGPIDLDDWLYPYFHSAGVKNTFALRDADLDAAIDAQRVELDENKRREIGFGIQRRLLALNLGVNFVSERLIALSWPYVKNFPVDMSDGYQHRFADCWIDRGDPTFRGRTAVIG